MTENENRIALRLAKLAIRLGIQIPVNVNVIMWPVPFLETLIERIEKLEKIQKQYKKTTTK